MPRFLDRRSDRSGEFATVSAPNSGSELMATHTTDYVSVTERVEALGCIIPVELTILPENFDSADTRMDFRYRSETATIRTLFRNHGVPVGSLLPAGERPSYITNKSFEWTAPTLFVAAALVSGNGTAISIALSVIANYLTDFFKGVAGTPKIKMTFVVERSKGRTCKKLEYEGNIDGIAALSKAIKEMSDE